MRLPDPRRSRVVLIGTSEYGDKNLRDIPAIETTINKLAATLTDLDYGQAPHDSRHCVTMVNEGDLREVGRRLVAAAEEATDLLLVYYAGRGLLDKRHRSLYLGLPDSDPKRPGFNSLEYAKLQDTVLDSRAAMKVIVLDCRLPGDIADQLDAKDAYVLASSFEEDVSLVQAGEIHTAFSRHLITILREGVPGGPGLLRIDDIYFFLLDRMRRDGLPQPQKRGTCVDSPLAMIRNRATHSMPRRPNTAPAPIPREARTRWFDEWMLDWVADHADRLTEHVPAVATEFLTKAVDSVDAGSERHAWFASRLAQARSLLSEQFFETGHWDSALAEATSLEEDLEEPATACANLGTVSVSNFHRDDPEAARRSLSAAEPRDGLIPRQMSATR